MVPYPAILTHATGYSKNQEDDCYGQTSSLS